MFGTYRFLLAVMVVVYHLWRDALPSGGSYAVVGFFVLSGYLMVRIVKEHYADGRSGLCRYLANRALRIYPTYLAVMILTLPVVAWMPEITDGFRQKMVLPEAPAEWAAQASILGLLQADARVVPPAWSLDIEIVHYLLIGLVFARSRLLTFWWLILAAGYDAYLAWAGAPFDAKYASYAGPSLFFAAGACLGHVIDHGSQATAQAAELGRGDRPPLAHVEGGDQAGELGVLLVEPGAVFALHGLDSLDQSGDALLEPRDLHGVGFDVHSAPHALNHLPLLTGFRSSRHAGGNQQAHGRKPCV